MLKRLAFFAFFLIIIYLLPSSVGNTLRASTFRLIKPLASPLVRGNTATLNFWHSLEQIPELRQQNTDLEKEVANLRQSLLQDESLRQENQALRAELGVTGTTQTYPKILAQVVLKEADTINANLDKTLTIDVGTNQGVQIGQPVVSEGDLIGEISAVTSRSATVRLIISSHFRAQAWLASNQEKGLLSGDGNTVHLEDITQGVKVQPDDLVETSGLGGSLPQNILIGSIGDQESTPSDLSQKFLVKIPLDPLSLQTVFVLLTNP